MGSFIGRGKIFIPVAVTFLPLICEQKLESKYSGFENIWMIHFNFLWLLQYFTVGEICSNKQAMMLENILKKPASKYLKTSESSVQRICPLALTQNCIEYILRNSEIKSCKVKKPYFRNFYFLQKLGNFENTF